MKVDGSCHCGAITYTAEVDPAAVSLCHCNDCQITAGSAFSFNVRTVDGKVNFTTGLPTIYIKKTAASGRHRAHAFCPVCATRIYSGSVEPAPPQITLRAGALRQRRELKPKRQVWCSAALDWATVDGPECVAEQ
ncbi:MAG: GFA family protein [Rhodospirillaceae bacterium]